MTWGLALAFIFSWPMATVGLVIAPIMTIGFYINQKAESEMAFDGEINKDNISSANQKKNESNTKAAQVLLSDAIANYKTVASFGNENILIDEYSGLLQNKLKVDTKNGLVFGFSWGLAQAVINFSFGLMYLASGEMFYHYPEALVLQVDRLYAAMFAILFGAFLAGQSM